jgi:hypothetical protein
MCDGRRNEATEIVLEKYGVSACRPRAMYRFDSMIFGCHRVATGTTIQYAMTAFIVPVFI